MVTKTAIILGYQCNNNCRFCYCHGKEKRYSPMSTEQVKKELRSGRERGSDYVDFLGGEPTIRKDLVELISYAREIGFREIAITSNGKMLAYKDYAEKLVEAGLNNIILSLHGHNAKTHNILVRDKRGFQLFKKGIQNIVGIDPSIYICFNTVVNKINLETLHKIPGTGNSLVDKQIDGIEFIFPHPKGNAWNNFEKIVPRLDEVNEPVRKAIKAAEKEGYPHIQGRYIPYCHMKGVEEYVSETEAKEKDFKEQHVGPEFQNLEVEKTREADGKKKSKRCRKCKYNPVCEGVWKEYVEKRGLDELKPIVED